MTESTSGLIFNKYIISLGKEESRIGIGVKCLVKFLTFLPFSFFIFHLMH